MHLLWKSKCHYCLHSKPQLELILRDVNSVHNLQIYFLKILLKTIFHFKPLLSIGLLPSGLSNKFSFPFIYACYETHASVFFILQLQSCLVAERSKARVCGRSLARIVDSNPTGGMGVCVVCCK